MVRPAGSQLLIGKEYWGKGVATKALLNFLGDVQARPLYARVAKDNTASIRVLRKCGSQTGARTGGTPTLGVLRSRSFFSSWSRTIRQERH
jgi:hypothetical protein